eukprot:g25688.t1
MMSLKYSSKIGWEDTTGGRGAQKILCMYVCGSKRPLLRVKLCATKRVRASKANDEFLLDLDAEIQETTRWGDVRMEIESVKQGTFIRVNVGERSTQRPHAMLCPMVYHFRLFGPPKMPRLTERDIEIEANNQAKFLNPMDGVPYFKVRASNTRSRLRKRARISESRKRQKLTDSVVTLEHRSKEVPPVPPTSRSQVSQPAPEMRRSLSQVVIPDSSPLTRCSSSSSTFDTFEPLPNLSVPSSTQMVPDSLLFPSPSHLDMTFDYSCPETRGLGDDLEGVKDIDGLSILPDHLEDSDSAGTSTERKSPFRSWDQSSATLEAFPLTKTSQFVSRTVDSNSAQEDSSPKPLLPEDICEPALNYDLFPSEDSYLVWSGYEDLTLPVEDAATFVG